MLKKCSLILSILLFAASISCNKSDNPISGNDNNLGIYGQVVGAHNKPIEGVNIHYIPELIYEDISTGSIKKTTPSTKIEFSIPEKSTVYFYILRYGTQDTLAVLINGDELNPGTYSVNFDENKLTNGVYTYIIKYDTTIIQRNMLLLKSSYSEIEASNPIIKTDRNGNFFLPYKMLGLGLSFIRTGMESAEPIGRTIISNNLKLFMTKDGYHNYILPLNIDTTIATVKTIVLNK